MTARTLGDIGFHKSAQAVTFRNPCAKPVKVKRMIVLSMTAFIDKAIILFTWTGFEHGILADDCLIKNTQLYTITLNLKHI